MDRKLISHRIGSILDDISRLSNALYALDTTDIQRYPDNYETLSIDAALRAERIACRLRHLIYSSTTIRKGDYLKSAGATHGITVNCEDRVLEVTLPCLLPKRKQRQSDEFLLDPLYFVLDQYAREHPLPYYRDCVVCLKNAALPLQMREQGFCSIFFARVKTKKLVFTEAGVHRHDPQQVRSLVSIDFSPGLHGAHLLY